MTNTELLDELEKSASKHVEKLIQLLEIYSNLTSEEQDRFKSISINAAAKVTDVFNTKQADVKAGLNIAIDKIYNKNR